ncbi:unnamed protein product [Cuscuta europaea]|uniref:Retrotransposon Copia-like N-terminal domain-containing protein n=1 Tax=Cuscuta europaea TaxID=41803 RepID=A0A9P0YNC4_CUSEU|nr:unnamed protein product [Cuscuta europaea]
MSPTSSTTPDSSRSLVSFVFSGNPQITSEKLNGRNYMDWQVSVEMWFLGQGLSEHLTKRADEITASEREKWTQADHQLVAILWQSIDPKLLIHFRTYKTCYDIWKKARSVFANDVQRIYDVVHSLATLQMSDHDLPSYVNKAQFIVEEVKVMLSETDLPKVFDKIDKMCMVFVLHRLHRDFDSVRNQILTNPNIPTAEDLIGRLLRVPAPSGIESVGPHVDSEFSALVSRSSYGGRGRGRDRGGRGTGGRPKCSHCQRMGHTKDKCYEIIGWPDKFVNVMHSEPVKPGAATKSAQNVLSDDEYKEYLQLKAAQHSSAAINFTGNSTACLSQSGPAKSWIIDSGASDHIAGPEYGADDWSRI